MTRIRFSFGRKTQLKHISHLDMVRLFHRALRRSGLPLAYSKGYNPHPRFNLAAPLPLAATAEEEYGEVFFEEEVSPERFLKVLDPQLPAGLELTGASRVDLKDPALPALVKAALYRAQPVTGTQAEVEPEAIREALGKIISQTEIIATRSGKKKKKTCINVRPFIINLALDIAAGRAPAVKMLLQVGSAGGVSPGFVINRLEDEMENSLPEVAYWCLHRERLYLEEQEVLQSLTEGM